MFRKALHTLVREDIHRTHWTSFEAEDSSAPRKDRHRPSERTGEMMGTSSRTRRMQAESPSFGGRIGLDPFQACRSLATSSGKHAFSHVSEA